MGLDALVVIGGDGTLAIAHRFFLKGIPVVGVPKTIDNDIVGTTSCFGFDTAVSFAADAIDRLHTTAEAHKRIMVVEVMGRYAGWIALHAGVAGGADVILIPEIPYDLEQVAEHIRRRDSARGASSASSSSPRAPSRWAGSSTAASKRRSAGRVERLGGVGAQRRRRPRDDDRQGSRAASCWGTCSGAGRRRAFDRVLATRFGGKAVELVRRGVFGRMVANHPPDIVPVPLADVVGRTQDRAARLRPAGHGARDRRLVRRVADGRTRVGVDLRRRSQDVEVLQRAAGVEEHDASRAA